MYKYICIYASPIYSHFRSLFIMLCSLLHHNLSLQHHKPLDLEWPELQLQQGKLVEGGEALGPVRTAHVHLLWLLYVHVSEYYILGRRGGARMMV